MQFKKIAVTLFLCLFVVQSIGFAAIGGKRGGFSAPRRPSYSAPSKAPSQSVKPKNDYKPSKNAKDLQKEAPAAGAKSNANAAAQATAPQTSRMGGMLRNMAVFAGGMMLGSMMANLFGLNGGFMADILGLLVNVALVAIVVKLLMMLWKKLRRKDEDNVYRMRKR